MEKNIPLKKFRAGPVSATVWENKTKEGKEQTTYSTISIERSYMDKEGKWQSTNSMRVNDLPKVALVTNKAYEFVLTQKHNGEAAA